MCTDVDMGMDKLVLLACAADHVEGRCVFASGDGGCVDLDAVVPVYRGGSVDSFCARCSTRSTAVWRRGRCVLVRRLLGHASSNGADVFGCEWVHENLCNACGLRFKKNFNTTS